MKPGVVGVTVRARCESCEGKGRIKGGDRANGEMVPCPRCDGARTVEQHMPLETFMELVAEKRGR